MRVPFVTARSREFLIEPLVADDARNLARLHRDGFIRPWSADEFGSLLAQEAVFGFKGIAGGGLRAAPCGFVLARHAAAEAEILTIVVARARRRLGVGRLLMEAVLRQLHHHRAERLFLEVDEANRGALALYRSLGFGEVGRRSAYYRATAGGRNDALVMRRDLR